MSDIEQATLMAKNMVVKWGLSDKVGTVDYSDDESSKIYGSSKNYSTETGNLIDSEIKKIVDEALAIAKKILLEKKADLEILARALLEYETLTGDEIKDILAGKQIRQDYSKNQENNEDGSKISSHFIPNVSET
jgi:cell division protease FtsH